MNVALLCLPAVLPISTVLAEEPTPGFNNKIPEKIMTPDKVDTRLGTQLGVLFETL